MEEAKSKSEFDKKTEKEENSSQDHRKERSKEKVTSSKGGYSGRGERREDNKSRFSDKSDRRDRGQDGREKVDADRRSSKSSSNKTTALNEEGKRATKEELEAKRVEEEARQKAEEIKRKEEQERLEEEKKQKEEEERKRLEEEEKKRAADEAERLKAEEEQSLKDFIIESGKRIQEKNEARQRNLNAPDNRPDEAFFSTLDSNLKKNTAFVKKLRNLTESQKDSLCKELLGLNLTKYIGEVASAITDAKLKMSDVPCAVHICGMLHERYAEFCDSLLETFNKYLLTKKDEKINNPSKYRVDLRLLGELIAAGVFTAKRGLPVLASQLSTLVNTDRDEHNYLPIITSFCKHCGDDYIGVIPRKFRLLSEKYGTEIPRSKLLPPDKQRACRGLLKEYFTSLLKHMTKDHSKFKTLENQYRKAMQTKGEVSNEKLEAYEAAVAAFQKLQKSTFVLSDFLDEDMPELPQDDYKDEGTGMLGIFNPMKDSEFQYEGDTTMFEDDDTRSFYETLPDLRAFIPGILYRDSENTSAKDDLKNADTGLEEEMDQLAVEDIEKDLEMEQLEEMLNETEQEEADEEKGPEEEKFVIPEPEEEDTETGNMLKAQFESFLTALPNCVNRDLIDKVAIDFCMTFNTKYNRKKLVKTLFSVHRTRYDLLPFYSRLVAILEPCMPELATDLVQMLKGDFKWHVRKKDQINVESKVKIVRFIGELVKFKIFPKLEALHCLKMLMNDFRHHNIEMACSLLETCGRFLYRSADSHYRTKIYLERMMRQKIAMKFEARYESMIENAFYYSNPPEVQVVVKKERPPMHEYIRKLLYKDLSKVTTEKVLRQMRKLKWDDPEIAFYATKCLTAVWNIRYNSVHCAANLLAGIAPYHEHVAIQVVDGILEDIRLGMEVNHPRYNQRRVSCAKYLGELYNYRMVESSVIFKVLYSFITFGVSLDENIISPLDPPEHLFRIRIVCVTLDTCGQFFDKGSSKKKLDCFLIYFQRYYWFKRKSAIWDAEHPFPIDIENVVNETLEVIRPKLVQSKSYEESCLACEQLETEYRAKIANVLNIIETGGVEEEECDDENEEDGLTTILEAEENEEELTLSGGGVEGSGTQDSDASMSGEEEGGDGEGGDGEGEDEGESSSDEYSGSDKEEIEDEEVKVVKAKTVVCQEDADFMAALDHMMNETYQARTQENVKLPQLDIALPAQLKTRGRKPMGLLQGCSSEMINEDSDCKSLPFVLMTRKGNKQQLTNFEIPMSADFAAKFKEREEAERAEKERMKQMVLNLNERQEEEEYQETLANLNRIPATNANRERKVKYQHPKGAPDADLIFGNKKR